MKYNLCSFLWLLESHFLSFTTATCETMRPQWESRGRLRVIGYRARQTVSDRSQDFGHDRHHLLFSVISPCHASLQYSYSPGNCISSAISLQVHSGNFSELKRFWQWDTLRNGHINTSWEMQRRAFLLNLRETDQKEGDKIQTFWEKSQWDGGRWGGEGPEGIKKKRTN